MWGYRRNNLRNTDYKNSATYKKYFKYVGKLIRYRAWVGHEKDAEGKMIRDANGDYVSVWQERLYMVVSVVPQRHYSNRYAFKLVACGEHRDLEEGAADLVKKFRNKTWEVME